MTLIICKYSNEKFSISFIYICLCDGIGRHARLKTLSIMGPGSSPGAGNISKLLIKLFVNLTTVLFFLRQLHNGININLLDPMLQYPLYLETFYSSWVLHVLFIYLILLLNLRLFGHLLVN